MPRPAAAADGVQGHPQQERRKGRGEVERGFRFPLAALLAAVFFFFSFARRQHRFPPVVLSLSLFRHQTNHQDSQTGTQR